MPAPEGVVEPEKQDVSLLTVLSRRQQLERSLTSPSEGYKRGRIAFTIFPGSCATRLPCRRNEADRSTAIHVSRRFFAFCHEWHESTDEQEAYQRHRGPLKWLERQENRNVRRPEHDFGVGEERIVMPFDMKIDEEPGFH
jgi:hypothetical protein